MQDEDAEIDTEVAARWAKIEAYGPKYAGIVERQERLLGPKEPLTGAERAWLHRERKAGRLPPKEPPNPRRRRQVRRFIAKAVRDAEIGALPAGYQGDARSILRLQRTYRSFVRAWDQGSFRAKKTMLAETDLLGQIQRVLADMTLILKLPG